MQDKEKSSSSIEENKNELERKFNVQCDISSVFQSEEQLMQENIWTVIQGFLPSFQFNCGNISKMKFLH